MTLDDRYYIEDSLNTGLSFKDIARYLCKDQTTISKEVRLHRLNDVQPKRVFNNPHNFCTMRFRCRRTNVCEKIIICDTKCDALKMDAVVSPLIKQGQSPYAIVTNHPELNISVKTLYNYIDQGVLFSRNIDLKRKPHFKPRKNTKKGIKNREAFIGRTYHDFKELNPGYFTEMDTVLSAKGSAKYILTFYIPETGLFIGRLLERCTERAVKGAIDHMERSRGTYEFLTVFETCLTDRGSEFGDPNKLETGINGIERMSLYYCDPMRSGQKGGVEEAHTLLRMILPKGTVFSFLTQWDIRKCVDHINSYPRAHCGGQTPYLLSLQKFGPEILRALQLKRVTPDDVTLTPKLLK